MRNRSTYATRCVRKEKEEKNRRFFDFPFHYVMRASMAYSAIKFANVLIARSICHRQPAKVIRDDPARSHGRSPISSSYFSRLIINAVCFEPIGPTVVCSQRR